MNLDEAIKTAIEFENKVEQSYREAVTKATDPVGKKVFETLANEEKGHIAYLESRLAEWKQSGKVNAEALDTVIPSQARIEKGVAAMKAQLGERREMSTVELQMLQQALEAEQRTSGFYKRMVSELGAEGQQLFARFVEIEEGHVAIVQAEIDSVQGLGYWFDFQEWQFQDG